MKLEEAEKDLSREGLSASPVYVSSEEYEAGTVFLQNPQPDATTRRGDTILLTVSSGPASVPMPDLRGTPSADAVARLKAAGMTVTVERVTSTEYAPDIVVSHTPEANTPLTRSAEVTLFVSGGEIILPSLLGLSLAEAEVKIREINLSLNPILQYVDTESESEHGRVAAQSPEEDNRLMQNTPVSLQIYRCAAMNPYSEITVTVPQSEKDLSVRITIQPVGSSVEYEDAILTWTADAERTRKISVKRPDNRDYTYTVTVDGTRLLQEPLPRD